MAEEAENGQEKTEDPTEKRRQDFREKGEVALSKEFVGTAVIAGAIFYVYLAADYFFKQAKILFIDQFHRIKYLRVKESNFLTFLNNIWWETVYLVLPLFLTTAVIAISATLLQTRFNYSFKKIQPDFKRLNPMSGIKRMVSGQAAMELVKGIGKTSIIAGITFAILNGEWELFPRLLMVSIPDAWGYWNTINSYLFWSASGLMLLIAVIDYMYNYQTLEKKMRMSKQEVKDEYKKTEGDPQIKARMRQMQRQMLSKQMVKATKESTVVVTNPTHYAVALKYERGMKAPQIVAKGVDFLALQMREAAKESDVPIIENKPLARTLYKILEVGEFVPEKLYEAVSQVISFVLRKRRVRTI